MVITASSVESTKVGIAAEVSKPGRRHGYGATYRLASRRGRRGGPAPDWIATPDYDPALDIGTPMPGSICTGPFAEGRTSMSKISVGMYTVEHEFGMSTTPDSLPSIGAEPKIMYAWIRL